MKKQLHKIKTALRSIGVYCVTTVFFFSSCVFKKSDIKTEQATVDARQYVPNTEQLVSGTSLSMNGGVSFSTHFIGEKEKFLIVFKCDHGHFFSINRPDLYDKLRENDTVKIWYKDRLLNDKVVDYEFVNAKKLGTF